jgi:hypothetical protein
MWRVGDGHLLLIGTTGPDIESRLANIAERCRRPSIAAVLADVAVEPAAAAFVLLSLFAGGPAERPTSRDASSRSTRDTRKPRISSGRLARVPASANVRRRRSRHRFVPDLLGDPFFREPETNCDTP